MGNVFDVSQLAPGLYVLTVEDASGRHTLPFVKVQ
jgi:hypothetical protein